MRKKRVNYIDNKVFYHEIKTFYEKRLSSPDCQIPNCLGRKVKLIADRLSTKGNFAGYTANWKQEMISDGIFDAIKALDNQTFNVDKWDNPLAYFTRVIWFAFIRRISTEKKEQYIRYKQASLDPDMEMIMDDETSMKIIGQFEEGIERKNENRNNK